MYAHYKKPTQIFRNVRCPILDIVVRASVRANLIHKCFLSKDCATMARAFIVYVNPLLEYASQAWSPYQLKDIKRIESRRFTKRLPVLSHLNYTNQLKYLGLER